MAFRIVDRCVACTACAPLCPHDAIRAAARHYVIVAARCNECNGDYDEAQCAAICPVEGAIVDAHAVALNPPGSLTGIVPRQSVFAVNIHRRAAKEAKPAQRQSQ